MIALRDLFKSGIFATLSGIAIVAFKVLTLIIIL
jgi:hypothetical protein